MDTYANLQTSIANWMARQDLNPQIPDFIKIAEAQLNSTADLRVRPMICKIKTTISDKEIGLPSDYLGMRLLRYRDGEEIKSIAPALLYRGSCTETLRFVELGQRLELNQTVEALDLDLFYYQKIPSLSDANTTNRLLDMSPNIYLYGALLAASSYLKDDSRLDMWHSQYKTDLQSLIDADKTDRWSGPQTVAMV